MRTGEPIKGIHIQKAHEGLRELEKWLWNNPTAQPETKYLEEFAQTVTEEDLGEFEIMFLKD